jgi:hypothetical protein
MEQDWLALPPQTLGV